MGDWGLNRVTAILELNRTLLAYCRNMGLKVYTCASILSIPVVKTVWEMKRVGNLDFTVDLYQL